MNIRTLYWMGLLAGVVIVVVVCLNLPTSVQKVSASTAIERQLDALLQAEPGAILAYVRRIPKGAVSSQQVPFLRWDLTYVRASRDYTGGTYELVQDQPLTMWNDYIDDLINGQCKFMMRSAFNDQPTREHMTQLGIFSSAICPIFSPSGLLHGALYLNFPEDKTPINPRAIMFCIRRTAAIVERLIMGHESTGKLEHSGCENNHGKS